MLKDVSTRTDVDWKSSARDNKMYRGVTSSYCLEEDELGYWLKILETVRKPIMVRVLIWS